MEEELEDLKAEMGWLNIKLFLYRLDVWVLASVVVLLLIIIVFFC